MKKREQPGVSTMAFPERLNNVEYALDEIDLT
jgi:hypothetical protein